MKPPQFLDFKTKTVVSKILPQNSCLWQLRELDLFTQCLCEKKALYFYSEVSKSISIVTIGITSVFILAPLIALP